MKRGLKVGMKSQYTRDELDARITPMKRGLKAQSGKPKIIRAGRCKDYPDEKGTERFLQSKSL